MKGFPDSWALSSAETPAYYSNKKSNNGKNSKRAGTTREEGNRARARAFFSMIINNGVTLAHVQ